MPRPPPAARTVSIGHVRRFGSVANVYYVTDDASVASLVRAAPAGQEAAGPGQPAPPDALEGEEAEVEHERRVRGVARVFRRHDRHEEEVSPCITLFSWKWRDTFCSFRYLLLYLGVCWNSFLLNATNP